MCEVYCQVGMTRVHIDVLLLLMCCHCAVDQGLFGLGWVICTSWPGIGWWSSLISLFVFDGHLLLLGKLYYPYYYCGGA
jgi:hypothetical protein